MTGESRSAGLASSSGLKNPLSISLCPLTRSKVGSGMRSSSASKGVFPGLRIDFPNGLASTPRLFSSLSQCPEGYMVPRWTFPCPHSPSIAFPLPGYRSPEVDGRFIEGLKTSPLRCFSRRLFFPLIFLVCSSQCPLSQNAVAAVREFSDPFLRCFLRQRKLGEPLDLGMTVFLGVDDFVPCLPQVASKNSQRFQSVFSAFSVFPRYLRR